MERVTGREGERGLARDDRGRTGRGTGSWQPAAAAALRPLAWRAPPCDSALAPAVAAPGQSRRHAQTSNHLLARRKHSRHHHPSAILASKMTTFVPALTLPAAVFERPAAAILLPVVAGAGIGYLTRRMSRIRCASRRQPLIFLQLRRTARMTN